MLSHRVMMANQSAAQGGGVQIPVTISVTTDNITQALYVNGVSQSLSNESDWLKPSILSANLVSGKNVICIEAYNSGSYGATILAVYDGSNYIIISDNTWKVSTSLQIGWQQPSFDDSSWANAYQYGDHDVSPWFGRSVGFPTVSGAQWIGDTASSSSVSPKIYLRKTVTLP